jgi:predicted nucleic acid-binding protein
MSEPLNIDKIAVVSNTGPLISALQCGRVDLLKHYFSVIYVTASKQQGTHYSDELIETVARMYGR